jgi:hypothetical protein
MYERLSDIVRRELGITASRSPAEIAMIPDDRILAEMTRRIFYRLLVKGHRQQMACLREGV